MFRKIQNELDIHLLEDEMKNCGVEEIVIDRIKEIVLTLDDAYGATRGSRGMGGYILFFGKDEFFNESFPKVLQFYHLKADNCEYSEKINNNTSRIEWWEDLYMLSSDDALVLVHPKEKRHLFCRQYIDKEVL